MRAWAALSFVAALSACLADARPERTGTESTALSQSLAPSDDTFVNSAVPNNNDGASTSIFTGQNGKGGIMRGLVRFAMPAALQGRVTVSNAALTMTVEALGGGSLPTAAIESLQPIGQTWVQGNGVGNTSMNYVIGQACGGSVFGASWNQADCPGGAGWTAPGVSVSGAVSATASSPATADTPVTWSSAAMSSDVQGWIDAPATNFGWRLSSSTEAVMAQIQRFYSSEAGTFGPSLAITYACKAGFAVSGSGCTTCTAAANADCNVAAGNACDDPGAPATTYTCTCGAAYRSGTGGDGKPACVVGCSPVDHCRDLGDATASCTDTATGYTCGCTAGFAFNGATCAAVATCGDGVVGGIEQCDEGAANGTSGACCTASCTFVGAGTVCAAATECQQPASCTGASGACPAQSNAADGTPCMAGAGECMSGVCRIIEAGVDGGADGGAGMDGGSGTDSGVATDSGSSADSGAGMDSGSMGDGGADSGGAHDSGVGLDSGAGLDSGSGADSGGLADGGPGMDSGPGFDAGGAMDSGMVGTEGGTEADGGDAGDAGASVGSGQSGGCGCHVAGARASADNGVPGAALPGLALLLVLRLRRRRDDASPFPCRQARVVR